MDYSMRLLYKAGGLVKAIEFNSGVEDSNYKENEFFSINYNIEDKAGYSILKVSLDAKKPIVLTDFILNFDKIYADNERIFCNGYQSWTLSKEYLPNEKMSGVSFPVKVADALYGGVKACGDYDFVSYSKRIGDFHSFTYSYISDASDILFIGSLNETNGYTVIKHKVAEHRFFVKKLLEGIRVCGEFEICNIMIMKDKYDSVFDSYFKEMKLPKVKKPFSTGYTTWYNHYQKINDKIVTENLDAFDKYNDKINFFQIDDGYQSNIGDWLDVNKAKFPNGMKEIADKIHTKGAMAGIWLAPFACTKKSNIFKNHKDWLVKDSFGRPIKAGVAWGGFYTIDFLKQGAREYLINVFDVVLNQWGFDMVKLDFLYQACMTPRENKNRGQLMCEAVNFLRECVGNKLILGCGVPLAPTFGKFDFCRIGCDVTLDWIGGKFLSNIGAPTETPCTKNSIINTVYRRHLSGKVFANDPDVFILREENQKLTQEQKNMLATANNLFGGVLFTSDNIGNYNAEQMEQLVKTYKKPKTKVASVRALSPDEIEIKLDKNGTDKTIVFDMINGVITGKVE